MPKSVEHFMKLAETALANIKVKSALNPLIWFSVVMGGPCFVVLLNTESVFLQTAMVSVIAFLIVVTVLTNTYFAIFKPDYLRSESYHIQKQSLEMMGTKADQLETKANHVVMISNPNPSGGE